MVGVPSAMLCNEFGYYTFKVIATPSRAEGPMTSNNFSHRNGLCFPAYFIATEQACHQYLQSYNHANLWLHPKTSLKILASIRTLQPSKVTVTSFWNKVAPQKWRMTPRQLRLTRKVFDLISEGGMLGVTHSDLEVSLCILCHFSTLQWYQVILVDILPHKKHGSLYNQNHICWCSPYAGIDPVAAEFWYSFNLISVVGNSFDIEINLKLVVCCFWHLMLSCTHLCCPGGGKLLHV